MPQRRNEDIRHRNVTADDSAPQLWRARISAIAKNRQALCSRAASAVTTRLHPHRDRIERCAIEFSVLVIRYANGATSRTQIRTRDRKLACEALGFFERSLSVFEDHAALAFELFVDDEIES